MSASHLYLLVRNNGEFRYLSQMGWVSYGQATLKSFPGRSCKVVINKDVCLSVRSLLGNFHESKYIHVYGGQWSPWRVPFDFFYFSKIPILCVWWTLLGQNLPQIRNFHSVGRDIRLVGSRIDLMLQMKSPFKTCAKVFDEIRILKGRNGLVNFEILRILRINGQLTKSCFCCLLPVFETIYAIKWTFL